MFLQAKRRLALDDSDHQYLAEPAKTPRGRAASVANGKHLKPQRSRKNTAVFVGAGGIYGLVSYFDALH